MAGGGFSCCWAATDFPANQDADFLILKKSGIVRRIAGGASITIPR
jgi:hypothetical protein